MLWRERKMKRAIVRESGSLPAIIVTKGDLGRLNNLIGDYAPIISWDAVRFLLGELKRARIVDAAHVPPTNVTMGSQVEIRERPGGETRLVTLAYPSEQKLHRGSVSILTPLGAALLGLSKEQSIDYIDSDGKEKTVEVLNILYQPEAQRQFKPKPRTDPSANAAP
jgi:regulator of nucleoside diphosphate kinase